MIPQERHEMYQLRDRLFRVAWEGSESPVVMLKALEAAKRMVRDKTEVKV